MKDVKLGVGTFIVREEAQRDLFEMLSKLREIGYEGVELLGFFGRSPAEIRSMLDALDLVALGNHLPLTALEKDVARALDDHREIGCPFLTISCPNDAIERGEYAMLAERMSAAARACVEAGITPLYHNHGFDVAGDRPFTDFILDACAKDGLCFEPDVGWIAFTGKDPADYLIRYRSICRVIHFKDIYADDLSKVGPESELSGVERDPAHGGFAFRPTGYGIVNTPRLLPLALACDPAWLMVDHDLAYGRDSFADLKLSHDYMRALMSLQ